MTHVTVRQVRQADGESLVETWNDARSYYALLDPDFLQGPERPLDADGFAMSLRRADDDRSRFVRVAEVDGRVVGFITAHMDEPTANPQEQLVRDLGVRRAYVDVLVVHRSCWRQGVGRSLMEAAEGWARDEGAAVIKTDTNLQTPRSRFPSTSRSDTTVRRSSFGRRCRRDAPLSPVPGLSNLELMGDEHRFRSATAMDTDFLFDMLVEAVNWTPERRLSR